MSPRLPAHLEVSALLRRVQDAGGFATVIRKGERDAGTLLVVLVERGRNQRLFERMPALDGSRQWHCSKEQDTDNNAEFDEYIARRGDQDRDSWIIELDVADGERFIGEMADKG